jgi:hypothetical protein
VKFVVDVQRRESTARLGKMFIRGRQIEWLRIENGLDRAMRHFDEQASLRIGILWNRGHKFGGGIVR